MSTTIISVIINLLSVALPYIGVTVGTDELTTSVQTVIAIVTGLWIWFERVKRGDVNALGVKR
ncbi:MAG: hypothetical protein U1E54_03325 [Candidatus Levybacteria bacterium]|nr:hypothetical protein [Candidatus Levybacteria bacterium]